MLSSIRKFSTSFLGKVVIALIAIAFVVGFGFSGSFSGKQNIVAEINDEKILKLGKDYPFPIVVHEQARLKALEAFKNI